MWNKKCAEKRVIMTTILLIIVAVLAVGLGAWCWWFENCGSDDIDNSEQKEVQDSKSITKNN